MATRSIENESSGVKLRELVVVVSDATCEQHSQLGDKPLQHCGVRSLRGFFFRRRENPNRLSERVLYDTKYSSINFSLDWEYFLVANPFQLDSILFPLPEKYKLFSFLYEELLIHLMELLTFWRLYGQWGRFWYQNFLFFFFSFWGGSLDKQQENIRTYDMAAVVVVSCQPPPRLVQSTCNACVDHKNCCLRHVFSYRSASLNPIFIRYYGRTAEMMSWRAFLNDALKFRLMEPGYE